MTATAPAPVAPPTLFDRTTSLRSRSAHEHEAVLDESWRSLAGVHGGYQVALSVLAAERAEPEREVRTVATSFLRPALPGPATVLVERVRRGRAITTLSVRLLQRDRVAATSRITMVERRDGADWHEPVDLGVVPPAQAIPLEPPAEAGLVPHFDHAEAMLDPTHLPFSRSGVARVGGHVRPLEPRPIDAAWLAMIVDWFPPAAFTRTDPPVGGISVDLTVHLHGTRSELAEGEWLTGAFDAEVSRGALALERGRIADVDGTLLAESFHTRWTG